jgi:hypothetical protein
MAASNLIRPNALSDLGNFSPAQLRAALGNLSEREQEELLALLELEEQDEIWAKIGERVSDWERGPLLWLTSFTKTEDTHWMAKGTEFLSPFPKKSYLRVVMEYFLTRAGLFLPKSREMMMSWLVCGYIAWECQWFPVFWLAQTGKEDKVAELIGYARILYRNQPEWMKRRNPLIVDNDTELAWQNGGRFLGIPKGMDQARMHHPKGYFQDESAFLPEAQQAHDAVRPVCKQVICVSSDEIGWFHNETKLEA